MPKFVATPFNVCDRCGGNCCIYRTKSRTRYYRCDRCSSELHKPYTWKVVFQPQRPIARSSSEEPTAKSPLP